MLVWQLALLSKAPVFVLVLGYVGVNEVDRLAGTAISGAWSMKVLLVFFVP